MNSRSVGIVIGAVALALLGVFVWLMGAQFLHGIIWFFWSQFAWVVPLLVSGLLFIFGGYRISTMQGGGAALGAGILSSLLAVGMMFTISYQKAQNYHVSVEASEVAAEDISYRDRAPFDVASAMSNNNMGDSTGNATGQVRSLPALGEHGMYSTSLTRREMFSGYETTQFMEVPLYGQADRNKVETCDWSDDAPLRFGGMVPKNNFKRAVMWNTAPTVSIDQENALTVCEEGTPVLYAALTTLKGFPFPIEVPAGVAMYNGETGELTIEDNYEGDLPLYPSTLAAKQLDSTHASIGWWDYIVMKKGGWEDTESDAGDPNGENRAHFNMAIEDGSETHKVTPLTARGSATSIIALGAVDSGNITKGELNTYAVNTYSDEDSRQANTTVRDIITADILGGYRAQGLTVFEVVPSTGGTWTATVGKSQSINYRAEIDIDGNVRLYDVHGNEVGGDGNADSEGGEDGEGIDLGKPLDEMTPEELQEAGDTILEELAERAAAAEQPME